MSSSHQRSHSRRRVDVDVLKLVQSKHEVTLTSKLDEFYVKLYGPKGTPYEGGVWKVRVQIPPEYPYSSPSIGFVNRMYHPNVDEVSGSVCLDVISKSWSAMFDLSNIFDSFLPLLLTYPNASDPLNSEAASLLTSYPEKYRNKVQDYIQMYATEEILFKESSCTTDDSVESSMSDSYDEDDE